jgi:hypothetical protein
MSRITMNHLSRTLVCGLALAATALPVAAAEPAGPPQEVKQVPEAADKLDLEALPAAPATGGGPVVGPQAVFRTGCILFPGQTRSYTFVSARGNNFYRVVPSFAFDAVMRVRLAGFLPVRIDRFFAGGVERYNFFSPPPRRQVTVTISGFRGSTGCFRLEARP